MNLSAPSLLRQLIGRGIRFPFSYSEDLGGVSGVSEADGVEKINSSIYVVLATRKGQYYAHPSFGCVAGDTLIPLLDGRVVPIRDLVGTPVWMYGVSPDGRVVPAQSPGAIARGFQTAVRVVLDSGEATLATPDHKFILRDGTEREAQQLQPGDSLMPLYRRLNQKGYEETYSLKHQKWIPTHRLVRNPGQGLVVHHRDFNKRNNAPENLLVTDPISHSRMHREHIQRLFAPGGPMCLKWQDPEFRSRMRVVAVRNIQRHNDRFHTDETYATEIRQKNGWTKPSPRLSKEALRQLREVCLRQGREGRQVTAQQRAVCAANGRKTGVQNLRRWYSSTRGREHIQQLGLARRKPVSAEEIIAFSQTLQVTSRTEVVRACCEHFDIGTAALKRRVKTALLAPQVARLPRGPRPTRDNHKVVEVVPLATLIEVFDLVNSTTGNFATTTSFIKNSNLPRLLFEPITPALFERIRLETASAIEQWVPQILLSAVGVQPDELDAAQVNVGGLYSVRRTSMEGSFVYPFRLGSGPLS